jgi:hypothetical protein
MLNLGLDWDSEQPRRPLLLILYPLRVNTPSLVIRVLFLDEISKTLSQN